MFENYERNMERISANPTSGKSLPSDEVFQLMGNYMKTGDSQSAVKSCGAIYTFEIVENKKGPVVKVWGIDLKNGNGSVQPSAFSNADATFRMTDGDFIKVCERTLNPQIAFLQVNLLYLFLGKDEDQGQHEESHRLHPRAFPSPNP